MQTTARCTQLAAVLAKAAAEQVSTVIAQAVGGEERTKSTDGWRATQRLRTNERMKETLSDSRYPAPVRVVIGVGRSRAAGFEATRESMGMLLDLPFEVLCLDHGAPITVDPHAALRRLLD